MDATGYERPGYERPGYERLRRYEPGWLLAGLGWGVFLGLATATAPIIFVLLTSGEVNGLDDNLIVPLMWALFLGTYGAMYGGVAGMLVGLVVMLAVGRDPEARAARRVPGMVALFVVPLVLVAVSWSPW